MFRLALLAALVPSVALADRAVPLVISHEGRLTDANDHGITGTPDLTFTLYTHAAPATDGSYVDTSIWTETETSVQMLDGYYNLTLGKTSPLDPSKFSGKLFLEIKVGGTTLSPRLTVGATPYALTAANAAAADVASALACTGCVGTSMVGDHQITAAKLATLGPGSGVDADTVDGKHASDFLQIAASPAQQTGSVSLSGSVAAGSFSGDGSALTNLEGSHVAAGTIGATQISTTAITTANFAKLSAAALDADTLGGIAKSGFVQKQGDSMTGGLDLSSGGFFKFGQNSGGSGAGDYWIGHGGVAGSTGSLAFYAPATGSLEFGIANQAKMWIDPSGNVHTNDNVNLNVGGALALAGQPYVKLGNTTASFTSNQAYGNFITGWTSLEKRGTISADTNGITIGQDGVYLIGYTLTISAPTSAPTYCHGWLNVSGTRFASWSQYTGGIFSAAVPATLSSGTTIKVEVYSGTLNFGADGNPHNLWAVRLF